MGEIWVVNASPVITLAKAGYLSLLEQPGVEVLLPAAVALEVLAGPTRDPARTAIEGGWGRQVSPSGVPSEILEWGLGGGETSVLAFACQTPGSIAVVDDAAARSCARTLGIPVLGTLGVVLRAKRLGLTPAVAVVTSALLAAGWRIDPATLRHVIENLAGERPQ